MDRYNVIGLMSGTSVDGVDLAYCRFEYDGRKWKYAIQEAETIDYSTGWQDKLNGLYSASAADYARIHSEYGGYLGQLVKKFIDTQGLNAVDAVASHGHTIFHRPSERFTSQIGEGAALAAMSGKTVICDFRTSDVAYGGHGAPLVPIGDRLLFSEYSHCLNLGGIANISYEEGMKRLAYDVCPCNFLLNRIAMTAGKPYDKNGDLALTGKILTPLLDALGEVAYYKKSPPKSLGREDMESVFIPLIEKSKGQPPDILRTLSEHSALQVANSIGAEKGTRILLTGGGAWNSFLVERIKASVKGEVVVPDAATINFKEALIFAFLGVLRLRGEANCLSSVTGASKDAVGGAIYLP